jgi:hypothetical protein
MEFLLMSDQTPTPAEVIAPTTIFHYDETGNRASYRPLPKGAHNDNHAPGWVWVSDGYYGTPADCAGSWVKVTCTGTGRYGFTPLYEPVDQVPFSPWALSHGWLLWWVPGDVEPTGPPPVTKGFDPPRWCRWVAEMAAARAGCQVVPVLDDRPDVRRRIIVPEAAPGPQGWDATIAARKDAVLSYPPGCTFVMGTFHERTGNISGSIYDRTMTAYKRQGYYRDGNADMLARQDLEGWADRPWACEIVTLPVALLERAFLPEGDQTSVRDGMNTEPPAPLSAEDQA